MHDIVLDITHCTPESRGRTPNFFRRNNPAEQPFVSQLLLRHPNTYTASTRRNYRGMAVRLKAFVSTRQLDA